jgi:hypothetical protein
MILILFIASTKLNPKKKPQFNKQLTNSAICKYANLVFQIAESGFSVKKGEYHPITKKHQANDSVLEGGGAPHAQP